MKILAIYQSTGHGSGEFTREANKAAEVWRSDGHGVSMVPIKRHYWRPWKMRKQLATEIEYPAYGNKFDAVAFFCHGTWKHLKLGWHIWNVAELASLLGSVCSDEPKVILYACSCGRGKYEEGSRWKLLSKLMMRNDERGIDGFAFMLSSAFRKYQSCEIFAHSSAGHTTKNPYVFRFDSSSNCVARKAHVVRGSQNWRRWYESMRSESSTLRYRFPFMSDVELERELER